MSLSQSPFRTTANNVVSGFALNSLTFNQTANASFNITGPQMEFKKDNIVLPTIVQNTSLSQSILTGIKLSEALTLSGDGTGVVTLGGAMDFADKNFSKTGTSSYVLTSAATLIVNAAYRRFWHCHLKRRHVWLGQRGRAQRRGHPITRRGVVATRHLQSCAWNRRHELQFRRLAAVVSQPTADR